MGEEDNGDLRGGGGRPIENLSNFDGKRRGRKSDGVERAAGKS